MTAWVSTRSPGCEVPPGNQPDGLFTGDYPHLCSTSREWIVGGVSEGRGGDEDGADAGEEEIRAIAVDAQAEFAA